MHAKILTSDKFTRVYHVQITCNDISEHVNSFIEDKRRGYQQPGIRPGEASHVLMRQLYQKEAESNGYRRFLEEWANHITQEEGLRTARILYKKLSDSKEDRQYEVFFDIFDELPDIDFKEFQPETPQVSIDETKISAELEKLGSETMKSQPLPQERPSRVGDALKINRQLTRGKKKVFEETITYIIRLEDPHSSRFVNRQVGEIITEKEAAHPGEGRPGVWHTHIQEIAEAVPCGVSENLAVTLGWENLEALRAHIAQSFNKQGEFYVFTYLKHQLFEFILKKALFHAPDFLIEQELTLMLSQLVDEKAPQDNEAFMAYFQKQQGMSLQDWKTQHRDMAVQRVQLGLTLKKIKEKENISLTPEEENNAFLETLRQAVNRRQQKEMHTRYFSDKSYRDMVHAPFLEHKIVRSILAKLPEGKTFSVTLDDLIQKVDKSDI